MAIRQCGYQNIFNFYGSEHCTIFRGDTKLYSCIIFRIYDEFEEFKRKYD